MSNMVELSGFGTGGGVSLNYQIVRYNTEEELLAATPREGTIGIITQTEFKSYVFSPELPATTSLNGIVILTGTKSPVAFNALRSGKSSILIHPLSVKQFVSGEYNTVPAKSYQKIGTNLEWVDWWSGELYSYGDDFKDITGGWEIRTLSSTSSTSATLTEHTDSLQVKGAGSGNLSGACTKNAINLTSRKKIWIRYKNSSATATINIAEDFPTNLITASKTLAKTSSPLTDYLDISSDADGDYKVNIANTGTLADLYIYRVWLE